MTAWPLREAHVDHLITQRRKTRPASPPSQGAWQEAGPSNIGGRATAIAVDPAHPERLWLGAAGGGIWFSADGGATWAPQWHGEDVLTVGSLAIDPAHTNVLYAGSGEANMSSDSYPGIGLYWTRDGGATWQMRASVQDTRIPRRIGALAVDPFDSQHLLLGGLGLGEVSPYRDWGGLYVSTDAGVSWTRFTFVSTRNYWCHAIVFHPTKRGTIFVTCTEQGARSGLYKSTDGGATWTHLTRGLPDAARFGRASIAISPSDPKIMYIQAANASSESGDRPLGVFRSADEGATWKSVTAPVLRKEGQMSYNNAVVVHPAQPGTVLCGGVDLYRTRNSGKTWSRATRWDADRGTAKYAHADHHALLMPAARPGLIYDANDGGLDVSVDGGTNWQNRSVGLASNMFYDIDVSQSQSGFLAGGAQDNGTLATLKSQIGAFTELMGGDGGWIIIDPSDARHLFASAQNMDIARWRAGVSTDVSPPASDAEKEAVWMVYLTFDPNDRKIVFLGSTRIWRTLNDGTSWKAVSPHLDDSPITAIEVAPADPRRVYVATENGGFFRSTDGGTTWSADLAGGTLPGVHISRIESAPNDANDLFVTVGNTGHGHVYRSRDGGISWRDIDEGRLPDVPHWALLIPPDAPNQLYVCSDAGVFLTKDGGAHWQDLSENLPNVMATDLVYQQAEKMLYVATYGRSIWRRHRL